MMRPRSHALASLLVILLLVTVHTSAATYVAGGAPERGLIRSLKRLFGVDDSPTKLRSLASEPDKVAACAARADQLACPLRLEGVKRQAPMAHAAEIQLKQIVLDPTLRAGPTWHYIPFKHEGTVGTLLPAVCCVFSGPGSNFTAAAVGDTTSVCCKTMLGEPVPINMPADHTVQFHFNGNSPAEQQRQVVQAKKRGGTSSSGAGEQQPQAAAVVGLAAAPGTTATATLAVAPQAVRLHTNAKALQHRRQTVVVPASVAVPTAVLTIN